MAAKKKGKAPDHVGARPTDCRGIRRVNLMVVDDYQEREPATHFFRIEVDFEVTSGQANLLRGYLARPSKGGDDAVKKFLLEPEYGDYAEKVLEAIFDTA